MFAKLQGLEKKYMELEQALADPAVYNDQEQYRKLTKAHADLKDVVELFRKYRSLSEQIEENKELLESLDSGDRSVLRKLRRYTATVHYNEFRDLLERGVISDAGTCVYRLTVPELYTRDRGLDPNYEVISVL